MWSWLNPLNIIKILSLLKYFVDLINAMITYFQTKKKREKEAQAADQTAAEYQKTVDNKDATEQQRKDAENKALNS